MSWKKMDTPTTCETCGSGNAQYIERVSYLDAGSEIKELYFCHAACADGFDSNCHERKECEMTRAQFQAKKLTKDKFLNSAESRQTSPELMDAILQVAGGNADIADGIWHDGPTKTELVDIVEIVTGNGRTKTTDYCWGESGSDWADS